MRNKVRRLNQRGQLSKKTPCIGLTFVFRWILFRWYYGVKEVVKLGVIHLSSKQRLALYMCVWVCIYASICTARRDVHTHTLSSFFLSLASIQQQKVCYEERRIEQGCHTFLRTKFQGFSRVFPGFLILNSRFIFKVFPANRLFFTC